MTESGLAWLADLGADAGSVRAHHPAVRTCHVDWSERRPHVSGPFGTTLTRWLITQEFLLTVRGTRALRLTARGARWFDEQGVPVASRLATPAPSPTFSR